ncbi:MAG: amidohydrolase [Maribacter sp.]|nr:MAG: amidohydrolase [Maribacter sp.]
MAFLSCRDKINKPVEKPKDKEENLSYAMSDFKALPKIDVHVHINAETKTMIKFARANNFRLLNVTVDVSGEYYPSITEQLIIKRTHQQEDPKQVAYSTAFSLKDWDDPNWSDKVIRQLKEDFDNGANSIKTWKNIGMEARDKKGDLITIDDPRFDPVFKFIKDEGKVLLTHAGEPLNCWLPLDSMTVKNDRDYFSEHPIYHMYLHPEFPSYEDQIQQRNTMLEKNPDLTAIAFHMASLEWSVDEAAKFLERFPNTSLDIAERISHTQYQSQRDLEKVRSFFIKYQDRIVYGTDFSEDNKTVPEELETHMMEVWMNDWKYFNTDETFMVPQLDTPVQGLSLPKKVVDKMYYLNAEKIFPDTWK